MKCCGWILRIIAIVAFVGMCVCVTANYSLNMEDVELSREEYEEDYEEHQIQIAAEAMNGEKHDEDDCYTCENYDDRMDDFDRQEKYYFNSLFSSILVYLIYGSILFAAGTLVAAKASCGVVAPQPSEPVIPTCPGCGVVVDPGQRFCNQCGSRITD